MTTVADLLRHVYARQRQLTIVQIGAFIGDTKNDPLFGFLKQAKRDKLNVRAVLVEPIRRYYLLLMQNYADCLDMVAIENVAIDTTMGLRKFYRLNDTADLAGAGMPPWMEQLGSLLPNRITELWDRNEKDLRMRQFLIDNTGFEHVIAITFQQLLEKNKISKIDLLQIDAEGHDYNILKSIDFAACTPGMINYESVLLGPEEAESHEFLRGHGYDVVTRAGDALAVTRDFSARLGIKMG